MWPALFYAACAVLALCLGYLACLLAIRAVSVAPGTVRLPSAREAADFVADVETFLRAEGY